MQKVFLALLFSLMLGGTLESESKLARMLQDTIDSTAYLKGRDGYCTTFSVSLNQWLTAQHCLEFEDLTINGQQVMVVKQMDDLALLNGPLGRPLPIAERAPELGDEVVAVGWPGSFPGTTPMLMFGRMNYKSWRDNNLDHEVWGIDQGSDVGMSGGPIINLAGEVVGVTEAYSGTRAVSNWSQPLKTIRKFLGRK